MNYISMENRIGSKIRELRKADRLTQEGLAALMNYSKDSRSTIGNWETGKHLPSTDQLIQLCNLFQCDIGCLFGDYDERYRSIADVCEITGLSENAVSFLFKLNKVSKDDPLVLLQLQLLSDLLSRKEFGTLLGYMQSYIRLKSAPTPDIKKALSAMGIEEIDTIQENGFVAAFPDGVASIEFAGRISKKKKKLLDEIAGGRKAAAKDKDEKEAPHGEHQTD